MAVLAATLSPYTEVQNLRIKLSIVILLALGSSLLVVGCSGGDEADNKVPDKAAIDQKLEGLPAAKIPPGGGMMPMKGKGGKPGAPPAGAPPAGAPPAGTPPKSTDSGAQ